MRCGRTLHVAEEASNPKLTITKQTADDLERYRQRLHFRDRYRTLRVAATGGKTQNPRTYKLWQPKPTTATGVKGH